MKNLFFVALLGLILSQNCFSATSECGTPTYVDEEGITRYVKNYDNPCLKEIRRSGGWNIVVSEEEYIRNQALKVYKEQEALKPSPPLREHPMPVAGQSLKKNKKK